MFRFLLLLPLLSCDGGAKSCTLIGCINQLTLQVTGAGDGVGLSGVVTIGQTSFTVDCEGTSDPAVSCDGTTLSIQVNGNDNPGDVTWSLSADGADSGQQGYAGEGSFTPEWSSSQPNGPDCDPTCWSAEATVELRGTP